MKEKISDTVVSLKNEYEQIPVPREARERMLAGIAQAKRENRRRSAIRLLRRTAAAGAAAFKRQAALAFSSGPKHFRQGETERQAFLASEQPAGFSAGCFFNICKRVCVGYQRCRAAKHPARLALRQNKQKTPLCIK